ncbi:MULTISPECIES: hypothetical protein [unclassified Streptomyces]|uniref:hypothetical protein n=1 Tax=unclassified Streptomyces TaxID=2593676 RepID=UPI0031B9F113
MAAVVVRERCTADRRRARSGGTDVVIDGRSGAVAASGRFRRAAAEKDGLDEAAVRGHAARELLEETGLDVQSDELHLLAVTRGAHHSMGLVYLAPRQPTVMLRERFAAVTASEQAQGREPELDRIALVGSAAELDALGGPHVDYLEPVVRRFLGSPAPRDA